MTLAQFIFAAIVVTFIITFGCCFAVQTYRRYRATHKQTTTDKSLPMLITNYTDLIEGRIYDVNYENIEPLTANAPNVIHVDEVEEEPFFIKSPESNNMTCAPAMSGMTYAPAVSSCYWEEVPTYTAHYRKLLE